MKKILIAVSAFAALLFTVCSANVAANKYGYVDMDGLITPTELTAETTTESVTDYAATPVDMVGDSDFILAFESGSYQGTNYIYVSADGVNGDGSDASPYNTITEALENAKPGDTILVHGGEYNENLHIENSGSADAYITLKNVDGEVPVIVGTNKNDMPMLDFDGNSYICVDGFEFKDYTARWCYGIYMSGGEHHIIIRNNNIHDIRCSKPNDPDSSGANGILLFGEKTAPISNIIIDNNSVHDLVTGWCEAISVTANCEYVNVTNNRVYNSTNIGIDFYGNNADGYCPVESLNRPRYCVAVGNEVYRCFCDYADCCGIYVDGARNILIERNISHDNNGGIEVGSEERNENYPVKDIVVKYNRVYSNAENGIVVGGWNDTETNDDKLSGVVYSTEIIYNDIIGSGEKLMNIAMCDGITVKGNVFYKANGGKIITSDVKSETVKNVVFDNNTYISPDAENEALFEMYGTEITGMERWKSLTGETGKYLQKK